MLTLLSTKCRYKISCVWAMPAKLQYVNGVIVELDRRAVLKTGVVGKFLSGKLVIDIISTKLSCL